MRELSVCIIVRNEFRYLLEWVAYHQVIGVKRFFVYDNESDDGTFELLSNLSAIIDLHVVRWPSVEGVSPQLSAYQHCVLTRQWTETDFLAFVDADEFIYLGDNLSAGFLDGLADDVGAVAINQRVFGSGGLLLYEDKPVIERFVKSSASLYKENEWYKSISKPLRTAGFNSPHSVVLTSGTYRNSNGSVLSADEAARGYTDVICEGPRIFHYMLKSAEEYQDKKMRGGGAAAKRVDRLSRHDGNYFSGRDSNTSLVPCREMSRFSTLVKYRVNLFRQWMPAL